MRLFQKSLHFSHQFVRQKLVSLRGEVDAVVGEQVSVLMGDGIEIDYG